jgi:hypothetical protein
MTIIIKSYASMKNKSHHGPKDLDKDEIIIRTIQKMRKLGDHLIRYNEDNCGNVIMIFE